MKPPLRIVAVLGLLGARMLAGADAAAFVSGTIPDNTQIASGATYTKTWTIRNTGTTTWNSNYSFQYVSGNAGCNHSTTVFSVIIAPNGTVTFTLPCTAPSSPGTYREDWRLVGPSGTILVDSSSTIWVQILVPGGGGADAAAFVSETVPDNTQEPAGASYTKTWTIRNTGTTTWDFFYGGFQYVSGNAGCNHNTTPFGLRFSLAPGGTMDFALSCVAPNTPGTYREDWRLVGPSNTIPVSGSNTIHVQIVVTGGGSIITTVAGNGSVVNSGDGFQAISAGVPLPMDVALDSAGNIYISAGSFTGVFPDCTDGCRIRRVLANGTIETFVSVPLPTLAIPSQTGISGLAVDPQDNIYVAQASSLGDRIFRINQQRSATILTTSLGFGLLGFTEYNGLTVNTGGNLFVASAGRDLVYRLNLSSAAISAYAGQPGVNSFGGDGGPASSALLNTPHGIAADTRGNLYIADSLNQRIRRIDSNGIITTFAGSGGPLGGFAGDGGLATNALLNNPQGVAVDSSGNVYIADTGNSRIRKVDQSGIISTIVGSGVQGAGCFGDACYSGDGGPPLQAQLSHTIHGITVDGQGNLYIADTGNNRVRKVTPGTVVSCSYSLSSTSIQAPVAGGNLNIAINTDPSCSWAVAGLPSWITVSGASSSTGPASVTLVVGVNAGAERNASISIAGIAITVNQSAAAPPPPPPPTCSGVNVDLSETHELLDVTLSGPCDNAILTIRNNKNFWTNFQLSGSASFSPIGGSTNLYAASGLLPPSGLVGSGTAVQFDVHFSKSHDWISIFVDPTGQTGNGAAYWMNGAQVILNAIPTFRGGLLRFPQLVVNNHQVVTQAFAQMPHLSNFVTALLSNPPNVTTSLKELGLFRASVAEKNNFATLVGTLAVSNGTAFSKSALLSAIESLVGWSYRVMYAAVQAFGNVFDFLFRLPAGSVLLTAQ